MPTAAIIDVETKFSAGAGSVVLSGLASTTDSESWISAFFMHLTKGAFFQTPATHDLLCFA